jgi:hypothetical protein
LREGGVGQDERDGQGDGKNRKDRGAESHEISVGKSELLAGAREL